MHKWNGMRLEFHGVGGNFVGINGELTVNSWGLMGGNEI